ncbi:hypothetical protein D3C71_1289580 [compost metagenome]
MLNKCIERLRGNAGDDNPKENHADVAVERPFSGNADQILRQSILQRIKRGIAIQITGHVGRQPAVMLKTMSECHSAVAEFGNIAAHLIIQPKLPLLRQKKRSGQRGNNLR